MDQYTLKTLLRYNRRTGLFTSLKTGRVVGTLRKGGHVQINLGRKCFLAHRLAWLYVYGVWPPDQLDHRNRIKSDNRLKNLEESNALRNSWNLNTRKRNTSGYTGVSFYKKTGKWLAKIRDNRKQIYLGLFDTAEEAHQAYLKAKQKYHY